MGLRQIAKAVGVDPRGDTAKEMIGVLSGLDPQSLEGIKRGVTEMGLSSSEPGEISSSIRGVLSGAAPPEQLLEMAQAATRSPSAEEGEEEEPEQGSILGGGGGKPFTHAPYGMGPAGFGFQGAPTEQPQQPLPPPGTPGGGPVTFPERKALPEPMRLGGPTEEEEELVEAEAPELPAPKPKNVSPGRQEVEAEIPGMLNMPPGRYRLEDVQKEYRKIPTDPKRREKFIEQIDTLQTGVLNSTAMINHIAALSEGRPEVLDLLSVRLPYIGEWGANPSAIFENMKEFVKSLGVFNDKTTPGNREFIDKANKVVDKVLYEWTGLGGMVDQLGNAAETRARINSIIVPLAFSMARAAQGDKGVLTDQDVYYQLERLGRSQSPRTFRAALEETANVLYSEYKQNTKVRAGKEIPIAHLATDDVVAAMDMGRIYPRGFREERGDVKIPGQTTEMAGPTQQTVKRAEPTLEQEEAEQAKLARREQMRKEAQFGMAVEQHGLAKRAGQLREAEAGRAEERHQMALRQEQRMLADKRREQIQNMFLAFGRALQSQPSSGGVAAPAVPQQSAEAFQIGQIQRLPPPTIPGAPRRRSQGG
jgi:hypothetical protein